MNACIFACRMIKFSSPTFMNLASGYFYTQTDLSNYYYYNDLSLWNMKLGFLPFGLSSCVSSPKYFYTSSDFP